MVRVVRPAGFEPAASCSGGKRSIRLSYGRERRDFIIQHASGAAALSVAR